MGGFQTPYGGTASVTPGFATSTKIDLNQIGEARNSMLGIKLDQVRCMHAYLYVYVCMFVCMCVSCMYDVS